MGKKLTNFVIIAVGLYVGWYLLYQFYIESNTSIDFYISQNISSISSWIFESFGEPTIAYHENNKVILGLANSFNAGVWIGDECNGLTLFAIFSIFVFAFPGNWKYKLWFIPLGIILIHLLNALRVVSLILIGNQGQEYLEFNHTYTFTILMYLIIFAFWYIWVNKFGIPALNNEEKK